MRDAVEMQIGSLRVSVTGSEEFLVGLPGARRPAIGSPAPDVAYSIDSHNGEAGPGAVAGTVYLHRGEVLVAQGPTEEAVCPALFFDVQSLLCATTVDRALLHAGVVAFGDRLVAIPGSSHSGKTTLTAALLNAGATYYSDEQAIIDEHGRVEPFPRPLLLRDPTALSSIPSGFPIGDAPLTPHLIVLTWFDPTATWQPTPIPTGEAMMLVLAHSLTIRSRPAVTLRALGNMVKAATCVSGPRGDAEATAHRVAEFLAA